uniref:Uncharacterized protein n=1 Tax=Glossina morsitans morsitans TaxID=37546 RepID=A0A1B0FM42_GLOMM
MFNKTVQISVTHKSARFSMPGPLFVCLFCLATRALTHCLLDFSNLSKNSKWWSKRKHSEKKTERDGQKDRQTERERERQRERERERERGREKVSREYEGGRKLRKNKHKYINTSSNRNRNMIGNCGRNRNRAEQK